jgi:polyhydroxyalkanoate synthesis regulator phasin
VLTTPGSGELIWTNSTGGVSVSVGQILQNPIPEGLSIDNGILHLHPADAGNGGIVNTFAQNFSGQKTFFDKTFFLNETETSGKATFLNETRTTGKATFLNETETSGKATFLNETETSGKATFFQDIYVHGLTVGRGSPTGNDNTVLGSLALTLPAPVSGNTAIGSQSLRNCIGFNNIALGFGAGLLNQNGSSNIYIGNAGSEESNTIRIGSNGNHQKIFLAGISPISSAQPLYAGADGQLGILVSSARFKENIEDMDNSISDDLLKLHPVTFQYKDEIANGDKTIQYGLIAEEVAKVNPDLVVYDKEGEPYTIRYQMLTAMLVNAVQKEHKLTQEQTEKIQVQQKQIDELKENKQLQQKQINELNEKIQSLQKQMDELKQFFNNPKQK